MGRMIWPLSEVCKEVKGRAKEEGLNVSVEKTKVLYTIGEQKE